MIAGTIRDTVGNHTAGESQTDWDFDGLRSEYLGYLTGEDDFRYAPEQLHKVSREDLCETLTERALALYHAKEALFGEEIFRELERKILLQNVDIAWMDHIDAMDDLKGSIGLQAYAQRDPVTEYRIQGSEMFAAMIADIRERTVRMLLTAVMPAVPKKIERVQVANPLTEGFEGSKSSPKKIVLTPRKNVAKPGRNDPCPCGSGKKYKKCCGAREPDVGQK